MKARTRSRAVALAKLALGVGLLAALLLWRDNAGKIVDIFLRFRFEYLVVLAVVAFLMRWISAVKWSVLLRDRDVRLPIWRLFCLNLIGQFFNNFMPSMVGGDIAKIYLLGRQIKSHARTAASVFMDRFTGLISLIVLVFAFSALNTELMADPLIGFSVGATTLGCVALVLLIASGKTLTRLGERFRAVPLAGRVIGPLTRFHGELIHYRRSYGTLLFAFVCSVLFYFLASVSVYFSCYAIGFYPSFLDVALVTPIIFLVTTIPVSPNNIGWWEWAVSLLLTGTQATMADGLMVALTMRAVSTAISLLGGVLFLVEKVELPARRPQ